MRKFLFVLSLLLVSVCGTFAQQATIALQGEDGRKEAIEFKYFPHREYAFVWRNWSVVDKHRLAEVMQTSVENVERLAESMGLPRKQVIEPEWATTRGYITILKRNWHLLPYDQLLQLLGMTREELKFRLTEDDFLYQKLGYVKPWCQPLKYETPTAEMEKRAADIAQLLSSMGKHALKYEEPRFDFMREYDKVKQVKVSQSTSSSDDNFELKMIFPYFTDFGDPLLDESMSSYPEEYFRRLQEVGVNGIWLHSVLRMMVEPDGLFPGDSRAKERIEGLNRLVQRAAKYGVKVYLYVNEPRGMDDDFFNEMEGRKAFRGPKVRDLYAFCTSRPEVQEWLSRSMESVFRQVEGLGGVFTITASENYTSCVSRNHLDCPNCRDHEYAELIANVNKAIEEGVHRAAPDAKVIVWDWQWRDSECEAIIRQLPKSCWFMSVSEWSKPFEKGGVKSAVGEYSISNVGPGPRALKNWAVAREAGLKCLAKVAVNCTWEMSVVPQLPVLDLVARHAENLSKQDVNGVMLSWSLGGYPSENLKLFQSFKKGMSADQAVEELAYAEYGDKAGKLVREAWRACSNGFEEFPYHITTLYHAPHHNGPSNLFYTKPTGYKSSMVYGFAYDEWKVWKSIYPIDVWISQMDKAAAGFEDGVKLLREAYAVAKGKYRKGVETQLNRAEAVRIHLKSSAVQGRFFVARDRYLASNDEAERAECVAIMRQACHDEQQLIKDMLPLLSKDSSIAFESANQYFYLPIDLVEAYISVDYALQWLDKAK